MDNSKVGVFCLFMLLAFLVGCAPAELEPTALVAYYQSQHHNYEKKRELDNLAFYVQYVPSPIMAIRELDHPEGVKREELALAEEPYKNSHYFILRIQPVEQGTSLKNIIGSRENMSRIIQLLNDGLKASFYLETGDKKTACSLINAECDLAFRNSIDLIMNFDKHQATEGDLTLVFDDHIFQNGLIKFSFSNSSITDFPKLKIS